MVSSTAVDGAPEDVRAWGRTSGQGRVSGQAPRLGDELAVVGSVARLLSKDGFIAIRCKSSPAGSQCLFSSCPCQS